MNFFNDLWDRLDRRARAGLIVATAVIVIGTVAFGAWLFRADYQVLFADLAQQDAATMIAELDRMKTPYRLGGGGNTILVPSEIVHKTRLKLVGRELPLHGAVGFELFSNSEVGMTEFAQKVNYQRALQGELTRTILSLDEVQSARVHLVLSEQALFRKKGSQAKASISIAPKPGRLLDAAQIQGIQRLVSAAVPDIKPGDVTIVDQHGVAMTRRNAEDGEESATLSDGLDDKRALEAYLNKKVGEVLDHTFGAGQAIASVDVILGHEHTKVTTENVLGTNPDSEGGVTGVIVHERQTTHDRNSDSATTNASVVDAGDGQVISREFNYQVGRRVEQVTSRPGAISRINVAVVVRKSLNQTQLDSLKDVIASATGINKGRGDTLAVYSVSQITSTAAPLTSGTSSLTTTETGDTATLADLNDGATTRATPAPRSSISWEILATGVLVLAFLALLWRRAVKPVEPRALSIQEREQLLAQVHSWLADSRQQSAERF